MADDNLALGITKIGDLLISKKFTKIYFGDEKLTNDGVVDLGIPLYQRPYKWTVKNVIRLLDDIEGAMHSNKENYRVGTLILHEHERKQDSKEDKQEDKHKQENQNVYDIVDGQQRVITFALLLECCKENLDNVAFLNQELTDNSYNRRNVRQNHDALKRRIGLLKNGDRKDLSDYIEEHCELVVIITKDESEAFQFFDSQNARGKKLYPHDLLKAYHLREMNGLRDEEKEAAVRMWEGIDQEELSVLFDKYLYRLKMWIRGDKADELSEKNLDIFKGITSRDSLPFAQYYKSAFAYIDTANIVFDMQHLSKFQIDTPVIAGKPFFEYAWHYFKLLKDIQEKDVGCFINGNHIVEILEKNYKIGAGNEYTRALFDSAVLLYVDRFCHVVPSAEELDALSKFVEYAFIWAYSLRMQYKSLGWVSAQNYVQGNELPNSFNIYKMIICAGSPKDLFCKLSEELKQIDLDKVVFGHEKETYESRNDGKKKDKYSESIICQFKKMCYLYDSNSSDSNVENSGE